MKVSGFSFIRNAIKLDYPIVEAITSILPVCDEFIIAVGKSDDGTLELIKSIGSPKINIIETVWDENLRDGGKVLAQETNKALSQISTDSDWAFYIQGDEVVHEDDLPAITKAMDEWKNNLRVEGLLFKYMHFYASYDYIANSRNWYKNEIRIIRNLPGIKSYRDAQGFRIHNRKIRVKPIDAYIHHYGWVKHPRFQQQKFMNFNAFYHDDEWLENEIPNVDEFDYSHIDALKIFTSTHPKVIQDRINKMNWKLNFNPETENFSLSSKLLHRFEKLIGWRIGEYKNYKII